MDDTPYVVNDPQAMRFQVKRSTLFDPHVLELEKSRIFDVCWIYVGHESQVPKSGDYATAQVGRQPMILVRGSDGKVRVLYNRCPHRGNMICGDMKGNTGDQFRCSYHAWTFQLDGRLKNIPMMDSGYRDTRVTRDNPDCTADSNILGTD